MPVAPSSDRLANWRLQMLTFFVLAPLKVCTTSNENNAEPLACVAV